MKLRIIAMARHRNGVAGAPFDVMLFKERGRRSSVNVGILFDEPSHCAILDVVKLAAGDIAFGSNSWRGDDYEPALRQAVNARDGEPIDGRANFTAAGHAQRAADSLQALQTTKQGGLNHD